MKLNKRVALLTFPVILLSYLIVAVGIYIVQKDSMYANELARLQLQLERLRSLYQSYHRFTETYLFTADKSQSVQMFLRNQGDVNYEKMMLTELEYNASQLFTELFEQASFVIFNANFDVMYYFDSSTDPFASADPLHFQVAKKLSAKDITYEINYHNNASSKAMVVASKALDRRTLSEPMSGQQNDWVILQVAVETSRFDKLLENISKSFQIDPVVSEFSEPPVTVENQLSLRLHEGLWLQVPIPELGKLAIARLIRWLVVGLLVIVSLTVAILLQLIKRQITNPIAILDHSLTEVMSGLKEQILLHAKKDEIGNLSVRIDQLHTQLLDSYHDAKRVSETDPLTGLPNRLAFNTRANIAIASCQAQNLPAVLCYIDLDNFKYVNDKYGHSAGDFLLKAFSAAVTEVLEKYQKHFNEVIFSRLAGDEFSIIAWPADTQKAEEYLVKPVLDIFTEGCMKVESTQFPVTVSVGIACYPEHGVESTLLISAADTAMYQAKSLGKNQSAIFSESIATSLLKTTAIENALRTLNFEQELSLVFMPIVAAKTNEVMAIESLLRWHPPRLGPIEPEDFFSIAEKTGISLELEKWVIARSLKNYQALANIFDHHVRLSFNLSTTDLSDLNLLEYIQEKCLHYQVPPHQVDIEITQTAELSKENEIALLSRIEKQSFNATIDNFGTGYTSLMQLMSGPIHNVKLDRHFVDALLSAGQDESLQQIVELCHSMKKTVTAEGIETEVMAKRIRNTGCDALQGYHICKPVGLDELTNWFEQRPASLLYRSDSL